MAGWRVRRLIAMRPGDGLYLKLVEQLKKRRDENAIGDTVQDEWITEDRLHFIN
jgi:hypothetical protein